VQEEPELLLAALVVSTALTAFSTPLQAQAEVEALIQHRPAQTLAAQVVAAATRPHSPEPLEQQTKVSQAVTDKVQALTAEAAAAVLAQPEAMQFQTLLVPVVQVSVPQSLARRSVELVEVEAVVVQVAPLAQRPMAAVQELTRKPPAVQQVPQTLAVVAVVAAKLVVSVGLAGTVALVLSSFEFQVFTRQAFPSV
jgi:hypothetical protein